MAALILGHGSGAHLHVESWPRLLGGAFLVALGIYLGALWVGNYFRS